MAEKCRGAGRQSIGAGLKDDDQITDLGGWKHDVVTEQVERRAKTSDDGDTLRSVLLILFADRHG